MEEAIRTYTLGIVFPTKNLTTEISENWKHCSSSTYVQVLRSPIFFFSGMEADRNVKVVGGGVAVL